MGAIRRLCGLAALLSLPPIALVAAEVDVERALISPPQELAALLSGQRVTPIPTPLFENRPNATVAAPPPALLPETPVSPELATGPVVAGLQVTASPNRARGPAWWKVTDEDTTVWIMGTPDLVPMAVEWDKRTLQQHMSKARLLIVPGGPASQVKPTGAFKPELPPTTNLSKRLTPELYERLARRIDFNDARARNERARVIQILSAPFSPKYAGGAGLMMMPNEYTSIGVVTSRLASSLILPGELGNPVREEALELANREGLFVKRLSFSAASFTGFRTLLNVEPVLQQGCLKMVLDALDEGASPHSRLDEVNAWARGDVIGALKRADLLNGCPYGPAAGSFWGRLVIDNVDAIRDAMAQPGEVVAIVEFDPLLTPGGVLDRLMLANFKIEWPER